MLCSDKIKQRIDILVQNKIPLTAVTSKKIQIPVPVASESEKNRRMAVQHSEALISMRDGSYKKTIIITRYISTH